MSRGLAAIIASLLVVAGVLTSSAAGQQKDALHQKVMSELEGFIGWLNQHGVPGYVGEMGWPDDHFGDSDQWNALADAYFDRLDQAALGAVVWATGEWWPKSYKLAVYENLDESGGVESANTQAPVLEAHLSSGSYKRGINVSTGTFCEGHGLEATSSFSNKNTGRYEHCYKYDTQETFDYLAARGLDLVKIEFRWEILQRKPGGPLHGKSQERLVAVTERALQAGHEVILSMHNFGAYWLFDGEKGVRRPIGSKKISIADYTDVWAKLSVVFGSYDDVHYAIMSEPVGLKPKGELSAAQVWEQASQAAVATIRAAGDDSTILVNGYRWSSLADWEDIHPDPWIADPENNFLYTAHHYWDRDWSGSYDHSYEEEVQHQQNQR